MINLDYFKKVLQFTPGILVSDGLLELIVRKFCFFSPLKGVIIRDPLFALPINIKSEQLPAKRRSLDGFNEFHIKW